MANLGDLWVRLGLKSDGFKKGMQDAQKDTDGFGKKLMNMKAGAVAVWAAIGTAVVKFTNDFIGATNKMSDAFDKMVSGAKASYRTFLAELSNSKFGINTSGEGSKIGNAFKNEIAFWKRIFGNSKEAGQAAAEFTEAFDAEFELANSIKLQKGAVQQELNELYVAMRDTTLSPSARKAAMERYKALLEPLAQAEISLYSGLLDQAAATWQAGNSQYLSREYSSAELSEFFTNYGTDKAGMEAKYGELAWVYENKHNDASNSQFLDVLLKYQGAVNEMSNIERELGRVTTSIKKLLNPDVILEDIGEIEDIELDIAEIEFEPLDMSEFKKQTDEIIAYSEKLKEAQERAAQYGSMIEQSIISSTASGLQALTDMMMGIEGADMKQVMAAFLAPFGDTMKQMGSMIMAEGIAMEAFKSSFKTPAAAIAAGAALMAVGAAVSSGLQKLTANPASGGTTASAGGSASMGSQNYESTLTIEVTGKISGSDILIAGSKQQNKWNR